MRGSNRCFRSTAKLSPRRHPRKRGDRTGVSGIPPSSPKTSSSRRRGSNRSFRNTAKLSPTSSSRRRGSNRSFRNTAKLSPRRHPRKRGDRTGVSGIPPSSLPRHPREGGDPIGVSVIPPSSLPRHPREGGDPIGVSGVPPSSPSDVILANAGIHFEVQNTSQLEQTPGTKKPEHGLRFFVPRLLLKPGTVRPASEPASCRLRRAACQP